MLIFNREEVENSFKQNDNEIIQIESNLSFREFMQKLQNTVYGKPDGLQPEEFELHVFRSGRTRTATLPETDMERFNSALYTHTFNPGEESGLDEVANKRDPLYEDFERFTYGQNHDFIEVPADGILEGASAGDYSLSGMYQDLLDAAGVMPTLYDSDLPIKQLQDMSYMGGQLYFSWKDLDRSNRMPTKDDLLFFWNLNPYERAVITDSLYCPTHLLDVFEELKAQPGMNKLAITESMVELVRDEGDDSIEELVDLLLPLKEDEWAERGLSENYEAVKTAFVEKFRRAPRVLPEIYGAYRKAFRPFGDGAFTPDQISRIVDDFKLSNIQQIAPLHNEMLYLLSAHLNFSEIKSEHLQIFATYLNPKDYEQLISCGFLDWYSAHKSEVKISDLCNIARNWRSLHFDPALSPKRLLHLSTQVRGWCNAACVFEEYGIDFRNAIVAIPGRGLVVTDKAQKIRMQILDREDARVFTVGQDCHCCQNLAVSGDQTYGNYYSGQIMDELLAQHFTNINAVYDYVQEHADHLRELEGGRLISGGTGASCVANELTHPLVWVTIWEDSVTGKTIAQADTHYVADTNTLVYDNIEFVNDGNVKKLYDIIAVYAEQSNFDAIHIGTGYNQGMMSFGKRISTREMQNYKNDLTDEYKEKYHRNSVYSDYNSSAVKIKQNGEMLIFAKKPMSAFSIEHLPEDNEQFRYLAHPVCALFSDYSIAQRQDLLARLEAQELTEDELLTIAQHKPQALADYEILPLAAQTAILFCGKNGELDMSRFQYVRNPDSLLLNRVLEEHPEAVMHFDSLNVPRDVWLGVVKKDGSLIEYCPDMYLDEEMITEAVKNNPFSIKYIAHRVAEPLRSKMITMAVYKRPILAAHFPHLPEYVWVHICERKGQFGRYCPKQTYRVQKAMIESSVYNIDNIRHPDPRILEAVRQSLPSLSNNPRYRELLTGEHTPPRRRSTHREPARTAAPSAAAPREAITQAAQTAATFEDLFAQENEAEFSLSDLA